MKKLISIIVLSIGIVLLMTSIVWAPTTTAVTSSPVGSTKTEAASITADPEVKVSFDREGIAGSVRPEKLTTEQWISKTMAEAGVSSPVPVEVVPSGVCAGEKAWGCTKVTFHPGTRVIKSVNSIWISAEVAGTPMGKHTLLHELGHASGIVDECGADAFAIAHGASTEFQRC